jgi:hypothetical protein
MKRRALLKGALAGSLVASSTGRVVLAATETDLRAVNAVTLSGDTVNLSAATVKELAATLEGPVIQSHHASYDAARALWNAMIERSPALIVQPVNAADVSAAVQFAASHNLLTSVCCGRHSFSGKSAAENGLMIDLGFMHEVKVDTANHIAHTQGGARLGHVDMATLEHNMITVVGTDSDTGAGGLTLGGGMGRLSPKWGLTIDNLLSAQLVTPDGKIRECSASENADLFWAIRGGGGNFGVATRFDYRIHDFNPMVYGGNLMFAWKDRHALLRLVRDMIPGVPDELHLAPLVFTHGEHGPLIGVEACWCGDHAAGAKVLEPVAKFSKPVMGGFGPTPYIKMQLTANPNQRSSHYLKSGNVANLDDAVIEAVADHYAADPGVVIFFQQLGGAVGRVGAADTAFSHRDALWAIGILSNFKDPSDYQKYRGLVRAQFEHLEPLTTGYYTNFNEEDPEATENNYAANRRRLAQIKAKYDPANLFRLNANIKPAA